MTAMILNAMNALIQGSAADQLKKCMLMCWEERIVIPRIQIHDELCSSVSSRKQGDRIKQAMMEAVKLEVPMQIDTHYSDRWTN